MILALLALTACVVGAHQTTEDGHFCGTPEVPVEVRAESAAIVRRFSDRICAKIPTLSFCNTEKSLSSRRVVNIPVAMHVIYDPDTMKGYLTDEEVQRQLDQLNIDYAGKNKNGQGYETSWQFTLETVTRTGNRNWFNGPQRYESEFKRALAVNPTKVLNQYFTDMPGGLLGFCYLPDSFPETSFMHGCVNLYSSIPGGSAAPYNGGQTTTHEIGHGLGLYHVFQGGCNCEGRLGDQVNDTTCQQSPSGGCPSNPVSCGTPDNQHNYMDYSIDSCMYEFTRGQSIRMDEQVATYKPGFLSNADFNSIVEIDPSAWDEARAFQARRAQKPDRLAIPEELL